MSLFIASLNSGSNANCYYIGNENEAILIDAGLKCIEVERRMLQLALNIKKIKAIFISHEHSDHINGLSVLSKKYQIPVFLSQKTYPFCKISLQKHLIHFFQSEIEIEIGAIRVFPFLKNHDAIDPHSFIVKSGQIQIGVFTDLGFACTKVTHYFQHCDAIFLESNYCEQMLENGNYPFILKQRIKSNVGHLSNTQALDLFLTCKSEDLQLLILSHLSKNNNSPELVKSLFQKHADFTQIEVASRYQASQLFYIEKNKNAKHPLLIKPNNIKPQQLTLF